MSHTSAIPFITFESLLNTLNELQEREQILMERDIMSNHDESPEDFYQNINAVSILPDNEQEPSIRTIKIEMPTGDGDNECILLMAFKDDTLVGIEINVDISDKHDFPD